MERVPLLKEIVDHYCGLDRVTAKEEQEELEQVAKTLPASVPDSVKRFTDRAVLSLQVGISFFACISWEKVHIILQVFLCMLYCIPCLSANLIDLLLVPLHL